MATLRIGGEWQTLKLGRKKESALMRSTIGDKSQVTYFDYLYPSHEHMATVPVADSRKPVKKDEGDANVS